MLLWLKGMLIGLAIAAPVGPTGLLCIQRTLTRGRWSGILSGLGVASADALYGCIAGFGLASLSGGCSGVRGIRRVAALVVAAGRRSWADAWSSESWDIALD